MNSLNKLVIIYMSKNTDRTPFNISHLAPLAYIWELPNPSSRFLLSAAEQIHRSWDWDLWSKTFWQQFLSEVRAFMHVPADPRFMHVIDCADQITGWLDVHWLHQVSPSWLSVCQRGHIGYPIDYLFVWLTTNFLSIKSCKPRVITFNVLTLSDQKLQT